MVEVQGRNRNQVKFLRIYELDSSKS